jgi:phenylpyruvate tautomerase PptA (4-oxalocrotonate tautomerase family)
MPLYEVYHSYSITDEQRQSLATAITQLHCDTFATPSFFVHVRFVKHDATDCTYFMAGKPRTTNSNRIIGIVRTSHARSRADFDLLGEKIEEAWYQCLNTPSPKDANYQSKDGEAKRLLMVTFTPMITIREGGIPIPEAGQEGVWLKEQLPYFKKMGDKGIEDFTMLVRELQERKDLQLLME